MMGSDMGAFADFMGEMSVEDELGELPIQRELNKALDELSALQIELERERAALFIAPTPTIARETLPDAPAVVLDNDWAMWALFTAAFVIFSALLFSVGGVMGIV